METSHDRVFKFLSVFALSCVPSPLLRLIVGAELGLPDALLFFFLPLSALVGYALQTLFGTLARLSRSSGDHAYEANERFFYPAKAILPILGVAALGFAVRAAADARLHARFLSGALPTYDPHALLPWLLAVCFIAGALFGVIAWFYPFHRLLCLRTFFPCMVLFLLAFLLSLKGSQTFLIVCLALFLSCSAAVLNLGCAQRVFASTRTVRMTASGRLYNLALIGAALLLTALSTLLTLTVIVGIAGLVRIVFFLAVGSLTENITSPTASGHERAELLHTQVFSGLIDAGDIGGGVGAGFFGFFLLLIAALLLFLIFGRRASHSLFDAIRRFFLSIYHAILDMLAGLSLMRADRETFVPDYHDKEEKMEASSVAEYRPASLQKRGGYRAFLARLGACRTTDDKICFAYRTLAALWQSESWGIRASDTPRQMRDKLPERYADLSAAEITAVYEGIGYAGVSPDPQTAARVLDTLCTLVRRYCGE